MEAVLVGPAGHGREVAWCVAANLRDAIIKEDGTDSVEDLWVEVRLGNGRDDLVAYHRVLRNDKVN